MLAFSKQVPALILAGGFGTRLRSAVPDLPKPLAPVRGRPFLWYLLNNLYRQGMREFVLSLHHKADQILDYIDGAKFPDDMKIRSVVEPAPLGTGGAVQFAVSQMGIKGQFYVCNGDTWISDALGQMKECEAAEVVMGLVHVPDVARYGKVISDQEGKVLEFSEKKSSMGAGWINSGLYRINTDVLKLTEEKRIFSLEQDLFPRLVELGRLYSCPIDSEFIDIGIPADYEKFCERPIGNDQAT